MPSTSPNVRISREALVVLDRLAHRLGKSKSGIVEEALRVLEEKTFATEVHDAYRRLQADPVAWKDYRDEAEAWDRLSSDGLTSPESW